MLVFPTEQSLLACAHKEAFVLYQIACCVFAAMFLFQKLVLDRLFQHLGHFNDKFFNMRGQKDNLVDIFLLAAQQEARIFK